jgi:hypothetical protein
MSFCTVDHTPTDRRCQTPPRQGNPHTAAALLRANAEHAAAGMLLPFFATSDDDDDMALAAAAMSGALVSALKGWAWLHCSEKLTRIPKHHPPPKLQTARSSSCGSS